MDALVIGTGKLGSFLIYQLLRSGGFERIYVATKNSQKLPGMLTDLEDAYYTSKLIPIHDYQEIEHRLDYTFFAFSQLTWHENIGVNDRFIEARSNQKIIEQVYSLLSHKKELISNIVVLSNPVDLITRFTAELFPQAHVLGLGLGLDTKRVGIVVSHMLGISYHPLPCIGEHGRHLVPLLSHVKGFSHLDRDTYQKVLDRTFHRSQQIIHTFSIPVFGPWSEIEHFIDVICAKKPRLLYLSCFLDTPFLDQTSVSIGVPVLYVSNRFTIQEPDTSPLEYDLFAEAAQSLKQQYEYFLT